jgi:hypothetical protein
VGSNSFVLTGVQHMTVSFRQNVQFGKWNLRTDNVGSSPTPPFYTVDELLTESKFQFDVIRQKGAVLVVISDWTCDLDPGVDHCQPAITVEPLSKGTSGFNYRRVCTTYMFIYHAYTV